MWMQTMYTVTFLQCRHLIPALDARAQSKTVRPIVDHFAGHGCMDDLTTERSFH